MRRTYIILLALVMSFAGYSQKKPKINKALQAWEDGELAEAKEIIDAAIEHEKTKDDGKTWYYRGLIYATLDTTSNKQFANLSDNALEEAMAAFSKADEIDPSGSKYYISGVGGLPVLKDQQINNYYSYYFNRAVETFQNNQYQEAVNNFMNSYTVLPDDTSAYMYAAYAAHNGELYDQAKKHYRLAINKGAGSKDLYTNYVNIMATVDGDKEKALEAVNEALEKFPDDGSIQKTKINLLIEIGKVDDAKNDLIKAIENEPENANLHFTLGVLLEELGETDKAIEAYKKGIEADPKHYESNFNYGVLLINEANEVIKQSNDLGISKADQKKAKELEPIIIERLKTAMPQWERVLEIRPEDKTAVETLAYIYTELNMKDKAKKMRDKLGTM